MRRQILFPIILLVCGALLFPIPSSRAQTESFLPFGGPIILEVPCDEGIYLEIVPANGFPSELMLTEASIIYLYNVIKPKTQTLGLALESPLICTEEGFPTGFQGFPIYEIGTGT